MGTETGVGVSYFDNRRDEEYVERVVTGLSSWRRSIMMRYACKNDGDAVCLNVSQSTRRELSTMSGSSDGGRGADTIIRRTANTCNASSPIRINAGPQRKMCM